MSSDVGAAASGGGRDRRLAWGLVLLTCAAVLAFDVVFLPRLSNNHYGDVEFTGWSGPMGSRLLRGDRPYVDFVLPIPPGSFAVLAVIEKLAGRAALLQELWLNAVVHLIMSVVAYLIVAPLTSRRNAVLAAAGTTVTIIDLNKECAYDHTAQLVTWLSILVGVRALLATDESKRLRYWLLTGALAAFTLAFKQSTGVGIVGGWLIALGYLMAVELRSGQPQAARRWLSVSGRYLQGVGLGLGAVWGLLVLLGSTARAYYQAVFGDAAALKGGPKLLAQRVLVYLLEFPAYPASLALLVAATIVGFRLVRREQSLHVGDEIGRREPIPLWEAGALAALVLATFGAACWLLLKGPPGYPMEWILRIDSLRFTPTLGLMTVAVLFVAHLVERTAATDAALDPRSDRVRVGHTMNAVLLAAFVSSVLHNTSAPEFRPFYDNNPIIPLAFASLFIVLDRAALRWASFVVLAVVFAGLFGNKFFRAMTDTIPIGRVGHWAGMRVNDRGLIVTQAAMRVRALAKPEESVLVLPEDVQMAALIGRPRPPLIGAVVFVDQYAPRLAKDDIRRLDENLPKVIVVHPRDERAWQRFFRIWSGKSGAEEILQHVIRRLLPRYYKRDSSYPTTYLWEPNVLDVYVLKKGVTRADPRDLQGEEPAPPDEPGAAMDEETEDAAPEPEEHGP